MEEAQNKIIRNQAIGYFKRMIGEGRFSVEEFTQLAGGENPQYEAILSFDASTIDNDGRTHKLFGRVVVSRKFFDQFDKDFGLKALAQGIKKEPEGNK